MTDEVTSSDAALDAPSEIRSEIGKASRTPPMTRLAVSDGSPHHADVVYT